MQYKGAICVFYFIWELSRSLDHKLQKIAEKRLFCHAAKRLGSARKFRDFLARVERKTLSVSTGIRGSISFGFSTIRVK